MRERFTRFDKIAYILGAEERSIFDLHKITRGFAIDSLKNSLFSHPIIWVNLSSHNMGYILYL